MGNNDPNVLGTSNSEIATTSTSLIPTMQNSSVLFQEYIPESEDIASYLDRFECFAVVNNVPEVKKPKLFIASVGATVYKRLLLLAIPKKPMHLTYAEIESLLLAEYKKKPLTHVALHNFRQRKQQHGETFRDFYNNLRELSNHCEFSSSEVLKSELKNQIISGIRDPRTQGHYFMQADLSLEEVVRKAEIDEQVAVGVQHFRPDRSEQEQPTEPINRINDQTRRKRYPARNYQQNAAYQRSTVETATNQNEQVAVCYRCNRRGHKADICFFKTAICNKCQKIGHIAVACSKPREAFRSNDLSKIHQVEEQMEEPYEIVPISAITDTNPDAFRVEKVSTIEHPNPKEKVFTKLILNGVPAIFEADSGSRYTIMSRANYALLNICKPIVPCNIILQSYTGNFIFVLGCVYLDVVYKNKTFKNLKLLIVDENYDTVFGREWWYTIGFDIFDNKLANINLMNVSFDLKSALKNLVVEFNDVFKECTGRLKDVIANISVDKSVKPIFCRHRTVVYSLREKTTNEIDRLVSTGIYEPVVASEWATPLVIVQKAEGAVRLVGDYSVTVNRAIIPEDYPIPNIEEILCDFGKCKFYSKFDIREAYMHMEVDQETAKLLTVNTHKGLYKVNRLNYGVQAAPAKWQRYVENVFRPVKGCRCFYDDIKISSSDPYGHLKNIKLFLEICRQNGIQLKRSKCQLLSNELDYLGFKINEKGIHKTSEKVDAILKAPPPKNITDVKSFTGLVGFYSRFLPHMSSMLHPINNLLRKGVDFIWSKECQEAFNAIKKEIASPRVLCHFDTNKKIILATDASPFAIGAVLSHEFEDGERPIAFASRSLNKAERNYSQIDRESLAIYWGVRRFFNYLYGRPFVLYVDCKPLQSIFGRHAAKPALSATRLLHYALFLQGFNYEIRYRRSEEHANADFLSRFPVMQPTDERMDEPEVANLHQINTLPMSLDELAKETSQDVETAPILKKLMEPVPENASQKDIQLFSEFTIEKECVLFGTRVYIPKKFRQAILNELHAGHLGISKMKGLARSFVYWPGLDRDIEVLSKSCEPCQRNANAVSVPSHPWEPPSEPWERVHIDYAGPFQGYSFLIVVDAFSKWPEVFMVPTTRIHGTNSTATIEKLMECFARFGCPSTLVSDNGVQFVSSEFKQFCCRNYIKQIHSAPYHPQSNGQAERFVQTIKRALKIALLENPGESIIKKLQTFLMAYRRAPLADGKSPCQLLLGRNVRSRIDVLRNLERFSSELTIETPDGTSIWYRVFNGPKNWDRGILVRRLGQVMIEVKGSDGQLHRRHLSQVRNAYTVEKEKEIVDTYPLDTGKSQVGGESITPVGRQETGVTEQVQTEPTESSSPQTIVPEMPVALENQTRRSNRSRREPDRFSP